MDRHMTREGDPMGLLPPSILRKRKKKSHKKQEPTPGKFQLLTFYVKRRSAEIECTITYIAQQYDGLDDPLHNFVLF
jgi:hypothetical protein